MNYFLLFIAYIVLFVTQFKFVAESVLVLSGNNPDGSPDDVENFTLLSWIIYPIAVVFPAAELYGLYHLFKMF